MTEYQPKWQIEWIILPSESEYDQKLVLVPALLRSDVPLLSSSTTLYGELVIVVPLCDSVKKAILYPFTQPLTVYNPSWTSCGVEVCCHWLQLYFSLKFNCKTTDN